MKEKQTGSHHSLSNKNFELLPENGIFNKEIAKKRQTLSKSTLFSIKYREENLLRFQIHETWCKLFETSSKETYREENYSYQLI